MEPPVSYPQSDSYQGKKVYGRKTGCAKFGCFGIVGGIGILVVIILIGYYFVFPALSPNSLSGDLLDMVIVPTKDGKERIWVLTDGSFNFIKSVKSPGRTSTGRECYFCKTWTYVIDAETQKVISKTKTPYEDIITKTDLIYNNGKVWVITAEYGENEPKIEAYDAETNALVMDTKQFIAKFPELSAGLTEAHYDEDDFAVNLKTKDGRQKVYSIADEKLYKDAAEFNSAGSKDSTIIAMPILAEEDNFSSPRKILLRASGPKASINSNKSSLEHFSGGQYDGYERYDINIKPVSEKIYLEGILYYSDNDCAIIIHLDKLGKKSDRIMTCIDLKTGKEKWTKTQDEMFKQMKIDEEDDTFSSLFFTKSNIDVKRSGNLVVLQLKGRGIMGYEYSTGKKLFEMDI